VLLVPAQQHRNAAPAPAEVWTGVVRSDRDLWLLSVHGNVRAGLLVRAWLLSESPRPVPQGVWMRWGGVRGTPWAPYPNLNPPLYLAGEQQSVATPHAVRGWSHPPCRHIKIQSCCCLGSGSRWRTKPSPWPHPEATMLVLSTLNRSPRSYTLPAGDRTRAGLCSASPSADGDVG
jgi:hypothetical protein